MSQIKIIAAVLVTILSVLSVEAQSDAPATTVSTTVPPTIPATCQAATGLTNINATQFAGYWYEEVRAPAKNVSCVLIHVDVINNQTQLNIHTSYSASQSGLIMDQNVQATVNVSFVNANTGFNVSYSNAPNVNVTYKILTTDYTTSTVLCGFTNVNDPNTSFGIILTRSQVLNATYITQLQANAAQVLTAFSGNNVTNITQSVSCLASSAATSVPFLATIFAAFYALLKILN